MGADNIGFFIVVLYISLCAHWIYLNFPKKLELLNLFKFSKKLEVSV